MPLLKQNSKGEFYSDGYTDGESCQMGFSVGGIIKSVTGGAKSVAKVAVPVKVIKKVAPAVVKTSTTAVKAPVSVVSGITSSPIQAATVAATAIVNPLAMPLAIIGAKPIESAVVGVLAKGQAAQEADAGQMYTDANGNPISKEEYDRIMAGGEVYQDANGNSITKEQYDALMAAYNSPAPSGTAVEMSNASTLAVPQVASSKIISSFAHPMAQYGLVR